MPHAGRQSCVSCKPSFVVQFQRQLTDTLALIQHAQPGIKLEQLSAIAKRLQDMLNKGGAAAAAAAALTMFCSQEVTTLCTFIC